ncbi:MAG: hypothetical protein JST54_12385 [Deltaproteobacteria bacterium]|nr:hypothetical protein [Deltaproteobacteria bacterium]
MNVRLALLSPLLLMAHAAPVRSGTPAELRDLVPAVDASPDELSSAAHELQTAELRAAVLRQRVIQEELDTVDRLQEVLDQDKSIEVMPHEVVRLRAERSLLTSAEEVAGDAVLGLRTRFGADAIDAAEKPWSRRRDLNVPGLLESAERRAAPGARDSVRARVEAEVARVARAEHRLDDLGESVLPDVSEALTAALVDLSDGGSMLDVLEALGQTARVRGELVDQALDREVALVRLELLTGQVLTGAPEPRRFTPATQVGSLP